MNFLKSQFADYPERTGLYTAIIAIQCSRVSVFYSSQSLGSETVSSSVILLLLCIALNFYVVFREKEYLSDAIQGTKLLLAYIIFGILSLLWSPVPNAITTIPKCLEVLSSYLMISVILWRINDKDRCLLYLLQLCTIASLIGYVPELLKGRIWQHSSFYPMTGAFGCLLAVGLKKNFQIPHINFYIVINFLIMLFGTSSTTYIAFACGLFILLSSRTSGLNIINLVIITALFLLLYHYLKDDLFGFVFQGKSQYAIQSASGREYIWEHAMDAWKKNPIFGCGFIVAERNLHIIGGSAVQILSTHNGYLSVLLGTGLVGAAIFGIFYIKTLFKCFNMSFSSSIGVEMTILFPLMIVLTVNNMSVHAIGGAWDLSMPTVFALFCLINTLQYKNSEYVLD